MAGALSDEHLAELLERRFVKVSSYISDEMVSALVADIKGLRDSAPSTGAMPGHGSLQWFHFGPGGVSSGPPVPPESGGNPVARAQLVELVAELKASIEGGVGTHFDADWTELQYGYYPNGGWYHRHVDSGPMGMTHPALGPGKLLKRACSFVLYLNQGWTAADAGYLRVYDSRALDAAYQDVPPTAATLVIFKSDEVMHEVMPTSSERFCVIGWFNSVLHSPEEADAQWTAHRPQMLAQRGPTAGRVVPTAAVPPVAASVSPVPVPVGAMATFTDEAVAKAAWLAKQDLPAWGPQASSTS